MVHWEKTKRKIPCFPIFHRIAVLWCCKAQSHSSFCLKTNVKFLWFPSAKWKRSQMMQRDTDSHSHSTEPKKCIELQLLNKRHSFTAKLPNHRSEQQKPFKKVISVHDWFYCQHLTLTALHNTPGRGLSRASLPPSPRAPLGTSPPLGDAQGRWAAPKSHR